VEGVLDRDGQKKKGEGEGERKVRKDHKCLASARAENTKGKGKTGARQKGLVQFEKKDLETRGVAKAPVGPINGKGCRKKKGGGEPKGHRREFS